MRRSSLLIVLAVAAAGCHHSKTAPVDAPKVDAGPVRVAEAASHGSWKTAQALTPPVKVNADLAAGDDDWYRLDAPTPVLARVEAGGTIDGPFTLQVFDRDRNRMLRTTAGAAEQAVLPNVTCDGVCYLEVSAAKKTTSGAYDLDVTTSAPTPTSEKEPNNRYVDAQPIAIGGSIDGFVAPADDEDWYSLSTASLPAGQVMKVSLASPPAVRLELRVVRKSDQAPVGTYDASDVGQDFVLPDLAAPAAPEDGWYLVVRSAYVSAAGKKATRIGDAKVAYTLSVKAVPGAPDLEAEPNEDAAHATVIALAPPATTVPTTTAADGGTSATAAMANPAVDGGSPVTAAMAPSTPDAGMAPPSVGPVTVTRTGYLAPKGDADWYTFHVDRPSIVRAQVSGVDRVKLSSSVIDPAKKDERKDNTLAHDDSGDVKEPQAVCGVAVPAGDNYVVVEGAWKKLGTKWSKDYENAEEPYTLTLDVAPDDGTTEREPNDDAAKATPIVVGRDAHGYLQPAGDVDVWKLDVTEAKTVAIDLSAVPKLDLTLSVKDADGQMVGTVDKGRIEAGERLVVPFTSGSYLIEVREKGRAANPSEPYTLTLR